MMCASFSLTATRSRGVTLLRVFAVSLRLVDARTQAANQDRMHGLKRINRPTWRHRKIKRQRGSHRRNDQSRVAMLSDMTYDGSNLGRRTVT